MLWWILMLGCSGGPDLPDAWNDEGTPVLLVTQSDCAGQPGDDLGVADFSVQDELVLVDWNEAPFRCEQQVTGFWRTTGTDLEVLVQPADMSGNNVARCDCLYDVDLSIADVPSGTWTARLVTRGDNANLPNDLAVVATEEVTVP